MGVLGLVIILRGSFGGEFLIIRARAEVESETTGFTSKNAQKDLKIIYFRKKRCFASAFEKSDCFIYIGGEEAKLGLHLKNQIWRTNR